MDISGQVAIVTGGGSGLGAATARYLASKGAAMVNGHAMSVSGGEI